MSRFAKSPRRGPPRAGPVRVRPAGLAAATLALGLAAAIAAGVATGDEPGPAPAAEARPIAHLARIEGAIGPITADYLDGRLAEAREAGACLLIVGLDTPGGLDASMRQMVRGILASEVPVAVWVGPSGARAASAGVFLLAAAHVAAMAPATNVGAAHPVNMGGQMDSTMAEKVTNDAVAYLQGIARERGRNVDWSERVVRESVSVPADEALELGIVDMVVSDPPALLVAADGRTVEVAGRSEVLRTADAVIVERPMSWRHRLLQRITDPTIAYIFLMLGFYGLFFELSNPGSLVPGIAGAIFLLLAFLAFQSLPVNYVGILLIVLGLLLLLLEIKVTSYGALTVTGVGGLVLGSLMLYDSPGPLGDLPLKVIVPVVLLTVAFFLTVVGLGLAAQRRRHFSGLESLQGAAARVVRAAGPREGGFGGRVMVAGELWECRSAEPLREGDTVLVLGREGRVLLVGPEGGASGTAG